MVHRNILNCSRNCRNFKSNSIFRYKN